MMSSVLEGVSHFKDFNRYLCNFAPKGRGKNEKWDWAKAIGIHPWGVVNDFTKLNDFLTNSCKDISICTQLVDLHAYPHVEPCQ